MHWDESSQEEAGHRREEGAHPSPSHSPTPGPTPSRHPSISGNQHRNDTAPTQTCQTGPPPSALSATTGYLRSRGRLIILHGQAHRPGKVSPSPTTVGPGDPWRNRTVQQRLQQRLQQRACAAASAAACAAARAGEAGRRGFLFPIIRKPPFGSQPGVMD